MIDKYWDKIYNAISSGAYNHAIILLTICVTIVIAPYILGLYFVAKEIYDKRKR